MPVPSARVMNLRVLLEEETSPRSVAGLHEAGLVREHDGLGPVAEPQLVEHAADVRLDRGLGDEQRTGDLCVRQAPGHEDEHLALALGELVELGPAWAPGLALANSSIRRRVTDGASSASPAATTRTAATSSSEGRSFSRNPLAPARSASYTYSSRSNVVRMSTRAGRLSAASRRVASIPSIVGIRTSISDDVRRERLEPTDRVGPVDRLADDLDVVLRIQDHPEPGTHQRLVVGDQHPDRRVAHAGSEGRRARRRNPPPGRGPASSSPPNSWTRSRMPDQPVPAGCLRVLGRSGAVVGDLELERVRVVANDDPGARTARVPERVGQRFLHDAVRGQIDAGRERSRRTLDDRLDRQARGPHRVEELDSGARAPAAAPGRCRPPRP